MSKKAKAIMRQLTRVGKAGKGSEGHTPWAPMPDSVQCDRVIDPTKPVRNRQGRHVQLVSFDDRCRWAIRARVVGSDGYIHSFTKTGVFQNEKTPSQFDLFNVQREDYARRFADDKEFKV